MEKFKSKILKVGLIITYKNEKRVVSHVNDDNTFRLFSDDEDEPYYSDNSIGCFHWNYVDGNNVLIFR